MFDSIIQLLDGMKDVIFTNLDVAITTITGSSFGIAWIMGKLKLKSSRAETATVTTENSFLKTELKEIKTIMKDGFTGVQSTVSTGFKTSAADTGTVAEALNLMGQNSRAAGPETKAKLKNLTTSLSSMTKEKAKLINVESQEILKKIEIPTEINSIQNKIKAAGQSILDKYLSEDVATKVMDTVEVIEKEVIEDVKSI